MHGSALPHVPIGKPLQIEENHGKPMVAQAKEFPATVLATICFPRKIIYTWPNPAENLWTMPFQIWECSRFLHMFLHISPIVLDNANQSHGEIWKNEKCIWKSGNISPFISNKVMEKCLAIAQEPSRRPPPRPPRPSVPTEPRADAPPPAKPRRPARAETGRRDGGEVDIAVG